jgi:hypothetical protein
MPDGETLLFSLPDSFLYVPQLYKKLPYDPAKTLAPVTQAARGNRSWCCTVAAVASLRPLGKAGAGLAFGTWGWGPTRT